MATDYANQLNNITAAVAALKVARAQLKVDQPTIRNFVKLVHAFVESQFGFTGKQLLDFGFSQAKTRAKPTGKQTVAAATKAARTKTITGYKSPSEKKAALAAANTPADLVAASTSASTASASPSGGAVSSSSTPATGAATASTAAPVAEPAAEPPPAAAAVKSP